MFSSPTMEDSSTTVTSSSTSRPFTAGSFQVKLHEFIEYARSITYQDNDEMTSEQRKQKVADNLRFDQFCQRVRSIFGNDVKAQNLKSLYRKITMDPDALVDWSEIFGYLDQSAASNMTQEWGIFMVPAKRRAGNAAGESRRRDIIVNIKYVPSLDSYLTISQRGVACMWAGKNRLSLQWSLELDEQSWATGCDYLPNLRRIVICLERSLSIRDSRVTGKTQRAISIKPLEHSPQCVVYVPQHSIEPQDTILYGDEQGYVNIMTIHSKDVSIKTSNKNDSSVHVVDPAKLRKPLQRRQLHDDWVTKVKYIPDLHCFASSSQSSTSSFVMDDLDRLYDNVEVRGVSIPKGVNCFDYCAKAHVIVTGGADKIIRAWHPHIYARPTGKLIGHLFTIVDITCNEKDQQLISVCTGRIIRVWDIQTLTPLQIFTDNEERPGEKRIYSMLFDNHSERLLTGSSVLDCWPLTRAVQDSLLVPHTHDRPVVTALYNRAANQVVSVCSEAVIKVWEMTSGKNVYTITDSHGANSEITASALDMTGRRLVTCAADGSLKVWDFSAGQELKVRHGVDETEVTDMTAVTGVIYCTATDRRYILATGWNNQLRLFLDSEESKELQLVSDFENPTSRPASRTSVSTTKDKPVHVSDALQRRRVNSLAAAPNCLTAAIGCNTGDCVVFDLNTGNIDCMCSLPTLTDDDTTDLTYPTFNSVHAMLFLGLSQQFQQQPSVTSDSEVTRSDSKLAASNGTQREELQKDGNMQRDEGNRRHFVLVSCHEDSFIRFWDMKGCLLHYVSAVTMRQSAAVTCVCQDQKQNILATSDIKGYIALWDIDLLLVNPYSQQKEVVRQVASWRAHMTRIVQLQFTSAAIVSASMDSSVRVWSSANYSFIGYFGQHNAFSWFSLDDESSSHALPYDVTEFPLTQFKASEEQERADATCPLIVDSNKWRPNQLSAFTKRHSSNPKRPEPEDKKFFGALVKPKVRNDFLEGEKACDNYQEAVYRTLPIYRVRTPPTLYAPENSFIMEDDKSLMGLYTGDNEGPGKQHKVSVYTMPGRSKSSRTNFSNEKTTIKRSVPTPAQRRVTVTPALRK